MLVASVFKTNQMRLEVTVLSKLAIRADFFSLFKPRDSQLKIVYLLE